MKRDVFVGRILDCDRDKLITIKVTSNDPNNKLGFDYEVYLTLREAEEVAIGIISNLGSIANETK
jgi:hypothetical protein